MNGQTFSQQLILPRDFPPASLKILNTVCDIPGLIMESKSSTRHEPSL